MKKIFLSLLIISAATILFAGNPDRIGQAGGTQLLINPWAQSSGWNNANVSGISGTEAMSLNPSGIINHGSTQFNFSRVAWLDASMGISINSFGFTRVIGKDRNDAIGASVSSISWGDIPVTTVTNPDNTLGTYSLSMTNIAVSYAHKFSDAIHAGCTFRVLNEGISSVKAEGVCLDAGIQYFAGENDRMKFGISLRNVGPTMMYAGGGLNVRGTISGVTNTQTLKSSSSQFELPSMLHIGGSYDFFLGKDSTGNVNHIITLASAFTSNAFDNDQGNFGLQYSFKNFLAIRGGYVYETGIGNELTGRKAYNGPCAGVSVDIPFTKDKMKRFAIDYSFRSASPFSGTHTIGARLLL